MLVPDKKEQEEQENRKSLIAASRCDHFNNPSTETTETDWLNAIQNKRFWEAIPDTIAGNTCNVN